MTKTDLQSLAAETADLSTEDFLAAIVRRFGENVALASSMGAEDQVITDMLCRATDRPRIFTLDTGRLPQETYDAIEATRKRYGITLKMLFPDREAVETMMAEAGPNLFYDSVDNRRRCCHVDEAGTVIINRTLPELFDGEGRSPTPLSKLGATRRTYWRHGLGFHDQFCGRERLDRNREVT